MSRKCQQEPEVGKLRGIFILDFPIGHFSTSLVTGEQLLPIVWEVVRIVESIDNHDSGYLGMAVQLYV